MRMTTAQAHRRALTLTEVLVVIATAVILFAVVLPWLATSHPRRSSRINCTSHLKGIGLAFRMWSNDHNDEFPMRVSTNEGGSREFSSTTEVFRHFQALSNELNSPKLLVCPLDSERRCAQDFKTGLANRNLSYFLCLDADEASLDFHVGRFA